MGVSRKVGRGHGEGEERWDRIGVYGSWSVLIKMPSPQTGIGGSSPLHLWVTAIGPCCVMLWFNGGRRRGLTVGGGGGAERLHC